MRKSELQRHRDETPDSSERLRALVDASPDPIFFKDAGGHWVEVNPAGLALFGLTGAEYHGETDAELAESCDVHREAHLVCAATDQVAWSKRSLSRVEEMIPAEDGTRRDFDVYKVPLFNPDGSRKGLVVLARDMTERKAAEQALRASEQQLRRTIETCPDVILLIDDGRIAFANDAVERTLGFPGGSLIGRSLEELGWGPLACGGEEAPQPPGTRIADREIVARHADGRRVVLSVTAAPLDGASPREVVAARDVTERARLDQLKSDFLRIAAHELRTPLTPLRILVQESRSRLREGEPLDAKVFERLERQVNRLTRVVDELLDVALLEQDEGAAVEMPRARIDLRELVRSCIDDIRLQAHGRSIELDLGDEAALVEVDASAIERVISNLVDNALKYSEGAIEVRAAVEQELARFVVTDHGPGIAVEHRANLFSRFYRVASQLTLQQRGLGLGLFISRQIVLRHGGDIGFQSEVGRGSTFYFTLPRRR